MNETLEVITYQATQAGPHLLLLGAVHGNEKCGTKAIRQLITKLDTEEWILKRGKLTLVPVCNPMAYDQNVRYVERNLNRYFGPVQTPETYEAKIGNLLCPLLAECDYLLDIHSYTIGGPPFIVLEEIKTQAEIDMLQCLGNLTVLTGWNKAYANTGQKSIDPLQAAESTGTTEYARRYGATAITLECGQHDDPASVPIAFAAIASLLQHLALAYTGCEKPPASPLQTVETRQVIYHQDEGILARNFANFEEIHKHELIGRRASGEEIRAPEDGVIIMPKPSYSAGAEWFYFGVKN